MKQSKEDYRKKSTYYKVILLINATQIGHGIARQDLMSCSDSFTKFKNSVVDNYRRNLELAGYVEQTCIRGYYKVIKHIPEDLTSTQLRNRARFNHRVTIKQLHKSHHTWFKTLKYGL